MNRDKVAMIIRKCTLAPILAGIMLIIIGIFQLEIYVKPAFILYTFFFLVIFPVLAYPMQKYIPSFRDKGREGQRHLAMIFAFIGYLLECIVNALASATRELKFIGLVYLTVSTGLLIVNRFLHLRASGHAAGASAIVCIPVALKIYWMILPGILIILLVFLASLRMQRHTCSQLLGGTSITVLTTALLFIVMF